MKFNYKEEDPCAFERLEDDENETKRNDVDVECGDENEETTIDDGTVSSRVKEFNSSVLNESETWRSKSSRKIFDSLCSL